MSPGAGNVISGNTYNVEITDPGTQLNLVENNLFGTNAGDTFAVSTKSLYGVLIQSGASFNGVESNVISGNTTGVEIDDQYSNGNYIYFNQIGTDRSGLIGIGNGSNGICVNSASNTTIGYTTVEYCGQFWLFSVYASTTYYGNTAINNAYSKYAWVH
jgi:hypothetical protein